MKFMNKNGGFTLVELIVVIAILAILAGVAVPAYSGYVEKANKQADISLANEVANALVLHYYSRTADADRPDNMVASVVLSTGGASTQSDEAAAAMEALFGTNWATEAKLKYDKWGNGAAVTKDVVDIFNTVDEDSPLYDIYHGNADISYTDNIPELFDLMEDTAIGIAGLKSSLGSGASMVTNAAGKTMSLGAEDFSAKWASSAWDSSYLMGGTGSDYNANAGTLTGNMLESAIANAAVVKARNVALATYLKDAGYEGAYDAIANYTYKDDNGNATQVPDDAAGVILKSMNDEELSEEEWNFIGEVFPADNEAFKKMATAIQKYYDDSEGTSQAYTDGLAYYAMMSTVDSLETSKNLDTTNDETWWNDLSSAVDMYSAVANGNVSLEDLTTHYGTMDTGSNTVVAMLMVKNGAPSVIISPVGANP